MKKYIIFANEILYRITNINGLNIHQTEETKYMIKYLLECKDKYPKMYNELMKRVQGLNNVLQNHKDIDIIIPNDKRNEYDSFFL
jgi:hypothetical protein